jgi:hypothetical protein
MAMVFEKVDDIDAIMSLKSISLSIVVSLEIIKDGTGISSSYVLFWLLLVVLLGLVPAVVLVGEELMVVNAFHRVKKVLFVPDKL